MTDKQLLTELVELLNENRYEEIVMSKVHDWLKKNNLPSWHDEDKKDE